MFETDVLVIGAGPAGLTAALALSTYGIDVTVVTKHRTLSPTPRAHVTNQRSLEILRDLGVRQDVQRYATDYDQLPNVVYCASLSGSEFARLRPFGTGVERKSDYDSASPCRHADIAQNLLEPVLLRHSLDRGASVRFDTEYLRLEQSVDSVRTWLRDRKTGEEFHIDSRFLIGADGGNSRVARDLGLPFKGRERIGHSVNILFESDLSQFVDYRPAFLYIMLAKPTTPEDLGLSVLRPTIRWTEWLLTPLYSMAAGAVQLSGDEAVTVVRDRLGLPDIPVRIKSIDPWDIHSLSANRYSDRRVFCAGDAVHRHSPGNGLGSNTAIQDAYNLAWKMAAVLEGKAHAALLNTYDEERVPVGRAVVDRATKTLAIPAPIIQCLYSPSDITEIQTSTSDVGGTDREKQLHEAIAGDRYNMNTHGVEMNQRYRSAAIVPDGSAPAVAERDAELYCIPSTQPGAHLPHAWVQRDGRSLSTLDLVGKGCFSLLTGTKGSCWRTAAEVASERFKIQIVCHAIGLRAEITDYYGEWAKVSEIESSGCLLVRPDGYICFRDRKAPSDPTSSLLTVLTGILGQGTTVESNTSPQPSGKMTVLQ